MEFRTALYISLLFLASNSQAVEVWHGWMNLPPCTKVEWNNNGIFGTPAPTYREGPQELHGYIDLSIPNEQSLVNIARSCTEQAVASAGIAAVLTNWGAAWPAFQSSWSGCISTAPSQLATSAINFRTEAVCRW